MKAVNPHIITKAHPDQFISKFRFVSR